jgi:hypothetical protein
VGNLASILEVVLALSTPRLILVEANRRWPRRTTCMDTADGAW